MAHPPLSGETASLAAWLHQQALRGASVETILEGLCRQALALGLDLGRAVVAYLVFHPQFDGMTFTWTRDTGRAERQAATQPDIRRLPSPFLHMQTTSTEERHLLSATRFVVPDVASDHGVDLAEPAGSAGVLLILAPDRPQNTVESIRRLAARCAGRGFA